MTQLDLVCDTFGPVEFSALAREFPGCERIFVPEKPEGKIWEAIYRAIGDKAVGLAQQWGGTYFPIPVSYQWAKGLDPEALYEEAIADQYILQFAAKYNLRVTALLRLLTWQAKRREADQLKQYVEGCPESLYRLAEELGIPYSLARQKVSLIRKKHQKPTQQLSIFDV